MTYFIKNIHFDCYVACQAQIFCDSSIYLQCVQAYSLRFYYHFWIFSGIHDQTKLASKPGLTAKYVLATRFEKKALNGIACRDEFAPVTRPTKFSCPWIFHVGSFFFIPFGTETFVTLSDIFWLRV